MAVAELDRQISSLYYERSGLSKNKEALCREKKTKSKVVWEELKYLEAKEVE